MNKKSKNEKKEHSSLREQLAKQYGRPLPMEKQTDKGSTKIHVNIVNKDVAPASVIGESFHNPYTFIPFPKTGVDRRKPTPLTIDELPDEQQRKTGVLDLEVRTLSPFLTCSATPLTDNEHKEYDALTIGNDIIVPSTSIRGSLRTLMTIITGGTLGYLDEHLWLCQGRDKSLGPKTKSKDLPNFPILAKVKKPGDSFRSGTIILGDTKLIPTKTIEELFKKKGWKFDDALPTSSIIDGTFWIDNPDKPSSLSKKNDEKHCWQLKLSGKKVKQTPQFYVKDNDKNKILFTNEFICDLMEKFKLTESRHLFVNSCENPTSITQFKDEEHIWELEHKNKHNGENVYYVKGDGINKEGCFKAAEPENEIRISIEKWQEYGERHKHAVRKGLKEGDLIWIEPIDVTCQKIETENDIRSLQWARWGRKGNSLHSILLKHHAHILPDSMKSDGLVDMVTDLFGQVPLDVCTVKSFAARVKPHNLIFYDGAEHLQRKIVLSPLATPHPGCRAFYREGTSDTIDNNSPLKGYKVYRNTKERGEQAPWLFKNQGVYDHGKLESDEKQGVNKTVDLLKEGQVGRLRISFRALTEAELALLLTTCTVDWKLGGGKPLGLGHCRVEKLTIRDEEGNAIDTLTRTSDERMTIPQEYEILTQSYHERIIQYHESQKPVEKLRYPRAIVKNNNQNVRGGHVWFGRHAVPKKLEGKKGFELINAENGLRDKIGGSKEIAAQPLPAFDKNDLNADLLYGYDCIGNKSGHKLESLRPFDQKKDAHSVGKASKNTSQNRKA